MNRDNNGDTILNISGSYQDFDTILTLFLSGDLEKRLGVPILDVRAVSQYQPTDFGSDVINIGEWFQRSLVEGWEYEPTLLGLFLAQPMNPVFGNRTGTDTIVQRTVAELVNLLQSEEQAVRLQAAAELGKRQEVSPEVITAMVSGIQTSDATTAWQIALSLGQIVPDHPQAAIAQRQEVSIGDVMVELLVALKRSDSDSVDILLQLYSTEDYYLSSEFKLAVFDEPEERFLEQISSDRTPYLSLEFSGFQGQEFTIQLSWNDHCIEQYFVI